MSNVPKLPFANDGLCMLAKLISPLEMPDIPKPCSALCVYSDHDCYVAHNTAFLCYIAQSERVLRVIRLSLLIYNLPFFFLSLLNSMIISIPCT